MTVFHKIQNFGMLYYMAMTLENKEGMCEVQKSADS